MDTNNLSKQVDGLIPSIVSQSKIATRAQNAWTATSPMGNASSQFRAIPSRQISIKEVWEIDRKQLDISNEPCKLSVREKEYIIQALVGCKDSKDNLLNPEDITDNLYRVDCRCEICLEKMHTQSQKLFGKYFEEDNY